MGRRSQPAVPNRCGGHPTRSVSRVAHAHPEASRPQRNSLSRLWPVQIRDHSPWTFSKPRRRNWRKPRPCLDLAEDRLHRLHAQGIALPTPFGPQLPPHPVPGGQVTWVCDLGAPAEPLCRGGSAPARRMGPRPGPGGRRLPLPSNSQHRRILPGGRHRRCRWSPASSPQPAACPRTDWWPEPPRSPGGRWSTTA